MLDILIRNGRYADFDANKLIQGDVGVSGGVITALGGIDEPAARVIDARGMIISPGFVDIHMHDEDFAAEGERYVIAARMLNMGVTTCLAGNCGDQAQSVARFRAVVEKHGAPVNYMTLAGYNTARRSVAGLGPYDVAGEGQIRAIAGHIAAEIERGASGVSFGVEYDPAISYDEVMLALALQPRRDIFVSMHYRADREACMDSLREMVSMAKNSAMRFQISHLSSCAARGQMREALALLKEAARENPLLDYDTYPYDAACTTIGSACFDEKTFEQRAATGGRIMAGSGPHAGEYCDAELFYELRENAPDTLVVIFEMNAEDIALAAVNPGLGMIASDGILQNGAGHPRAAGTFPKMLSQYVREEGRISIMDALYKLSVRPAQRLGLHNKTRIALGYDADITVFDPERIRDMATYIKPALAPEGIKAVIINGRVALEDGVPSGVNEGRFIQTLSR